MYQPNPCKDCNKRKVVNNRSCHATCPDYAKFDEGQKQKRRARYLERSYIEYKQSVIDKMHKRKHDK